MIAYESEEPKKVQISNNNVGDIPLILSLVMGIPAIVDTAERAVESLSQAAVESLSQVSVESLSQIAVDLIPESKVIGFVTSVTCSVAILGGFAFADYTADCKVDYTTLDVS